MTERSPEQKLRDISASAQRERLLERLQLGPVDTLTARQELNVLHPAARIQELRIAGHPIRTHLAAITDAQGFQHPRCAIYYLSTACEAA
jgi:hypothetical protein